MVINGYCIKDYILFGIIILISAMATILLFLHRYYYNKRNKCLLDKFNVLIVNQNIEDAQKLCSIIENRRLKETDAYKFNEDVIKLHKMQLIMKKIQHCICVLKENWDFADYAKIDNSISFLNNVRSTMNIKSNWKEVDILIKNCIQKKEDYILNFSNQCHILKNLVDTRQLLKANNLLNQLKNEVRKPLLMNFTNYILEIESKINEIQINNDSLILTNSIKNRDILLAKNTIISLKNLVKRCNNNKLVNCIKYQVNDFEKLYAEGFSDSKHPIKYIL